MFTSLAEMDTFDDVVREILKAQQVKLDLTDEAVGRIVFWKTGASGRLDDVFG